MTEPTITIKEIGGCDDELRADERGGHFNIEIEEPWAGDTISGFGHQTHISLSREQAKEFADWIYGRLGLEVKET